MSMLEIVRGPVMTVSVAIFLLGITWRLFSLLFRRRGIDPSASRERSLNVVWGAARTVIDRFWPAKPFREKLASHTIIGQVFHIGLFLIFFLGAPHILFLADFLGFTWWAMPKGVLDVVSGVTLGALVVALGLRLRDPVRRMLSDFDDYLSWTITMLPVLTGLLTTSELLGRYELLLTLHILSVELLLVWLPFGKLFHSFTWILSRATTGARFAHRGVKA